jgi:hypothetical protein
MMGGILLHIYKTVKIHHPLLVQCKYSFDAYPLIFESGS